MRNHREEAVWQKKLNEVAKHLYPDPTDGFKRAVARAVMEYGSEVDGHGWAIDAEIRRAVEAINKLVEEVV